MKRMIALLFAVVMALSLCACSTGTQAGNAALMPVVLNDVTIFLPENWMAFSNNDKDSTFQRLYCPATEKDNPQNVIAVYYFENLENEFYSTSEIDTYLEEFIGRIHDLPGFTEIDRYEMSLNVPAKHAAYTQAYDGNTRNVEAYLFMVSNNNYLALDYYHEVSDKNDYGELFEQCITQISLEDYAPYFDEDNTQNTSESEENPSEPEEKPPVTESKKENTEKNTPSHYAICMYMLERYEYYDMLAGGYAGDKYDANVFADAAAEFGISTDEVSTAWFDYDANLKATQDYYG